MDTWQQALDYLYGLANWETRPPGTTVTFELDRIRAVLSDLGDPHLAWPAVHVAGTNGKGSICSLAASALAAAGHRVGLFTSPHLHTVRERVRVDGRPIGEDEALAWLRRRRPVLDRHAGLTTFEALTAMAFDYFAARRVDVAVVEVGLGGRLDTTNVVRPAVSVMAPIDLDHTAVLGITPEEIAEDKAGIIKAGAPAVSAPQHAEVERVLARAAQEVGVPLLRLGVDVAYGPVGPTDRGERLWVALGAGHAGGPSRLEMEVPLVGAHQVTNAATAATALMCLADAGWAVPRSAIVAGFASAAWPARFERLSASPVVIVDGAHNPHAAAALSRALEERYPGRRRWLVLGASRDKDLRGIVAALLPAEVLATAAPHPRSMPAADVAEAVRRAGGHAETCRTVAEALDRALAQAGPDDVVVAAGSIFVAAAAREAWAAMGRMPMPESDGPSPDRRT